MSKLSSKKRESFLTVLLSAAVLLTGLSGSQLFAAAYDPSVAIAYQCSDSAINISDHALSEWKDAPKIYFDNSSTDYFQLMWSVNRLYFAVSANDAVKNSSGLWCDQVRIGLTLPGGETGLGFFGADANSDDACWASVDQDELNRWWGESGMTSLFKPQDSTARYTYANGRVAIEGCLNFNDTYKSALTRNGTVKLAVRYYNDALVTSSATSAAYASRLTWGSDSGKLTDGVTSFREVSLDSFPESAAAYKCSDNAIDITDHSLSEWVSIPKNYFTDSSDYFQLQWSDNYLYFAVTAADVALNNEGWRDQLRLGITLPSGETGLAFFGADPDSNSCFKSTYQEELTRWWGESKVLAEMFDNSGCDARLTWANGVMKAEGRLAFSTEYQSALVRGSELKIAMRYYSDANYASSSTSTFSTRSTWGGNSGNFSDSFSSFGTVKLDAASKDFNYSNIEILEIIKKTLLKQDPPEASDLIAENPDKPLNLLYLLEVKNRVLTQQSEMDSKIKAFESMPPEVTVMSGYNPNSNPGGNNEWSNIQAITYDGAPINGSKTKIFAYIGFPDGASPSAKVPAVVLVHGGGGHAYAEWVKIWNDRGYAAIAMDTTGHFPSPAGKGLAGREGDNHLWDYGLHGDFAQAGYANAPNNAGNMNSADKPLEEQFMYHAVISTIMAHNILLADNRVDSAKIGISGISWGGVVTALAIGYDTRYAFGVPIYGSGYLEQSHSYFGELFSKPEAKNLWSAADRFSNVNFPTLWLAWVNDQAFSVNTNSLSYDALKSAGGVLSLKQNWNHSHTQGYEAEESYRFADSVCRGGGALITCATEPAGRNFSFTIDTGGASSVTARAYYITEKLSYSVRPGNTIPTIDQIWKKVDCAVNGNTVTGVLPAGAMNYYVEITAQTPEGAFTTTTRLVDING